MMSHPQMRRLTLSQFMNQPHHHESSFSSTSSQATQKFFCPSIQTSTPTPTCSSSHSSFESKRYLSSHQHQDNQNLRTIPCCFIFSKFWGRLRLMLGCGEVSPMASRRDSFHTPLEIVSFVYHFMLCFPKRLFSASATHEKKSIAVIQAINGVSSPATTVQKIIEGTRWFLMMFSGWKAVHVRRSSNTAAHLTARNAYESANDVIWVEETPPMIVNQIRIDVPVGTLCPE